MQKRYCRCGCPVWVCYLALPHAMRIKPVFHGDRVTGRNILDACPRCGRKEGEGVSAELLKELRKKYPHTPKWD